LTLTHLLAVTAPGLARGHTTYMPVDKTKVLLQVTHTVTLALLELHRPTSSVNSYVTCYVWQQLQAFSLSH